MKFQFLPQSVLTASLVLALASLGFVGLRPSPSHRSAVAEVKPMCTSVNGGDDVKQLISPKEDFALKVPTSRLKAPHQGWSVVLLPADEDALRLFWVRRHESGQWFMADKQTVMQVSERGLDFSPMHRLLPTAEQQQKVLFVLLPQQYWNDGLSLQPLLDNGDSRWGRLQRINSFLTAKGYMHPFLGVEQHLSGDQLSTALTETLEQVEPGSIYVPQQFMDQTTLELPQQVDTTLCPVTGLS